MAIVKLTDLSPPIFKPFRYFLLDPASQEIHEERGKNQDEAAQNASGYGGFFRKETFSFSQYFGCIYLDNEKMWVSMERKAFEVTPHLSCQFDYGAMKNTISLSRSGEVVYSCRYNPPGDEMEDMMEFIFQSLMTARKRKFFIYLWAASQAGIERSHPEYGYTDEVIDALGDPWEL